MLHLLALIALRRLPANLLQGSKQMPVLPCAICKVVRQSAQGAGNLPTMSIRSGYARKNLWHRLRATSTGHGLSGTQEFMTARYRLVRFSWRKTEQTKEIICLVPKSKEISECIKG